LTTGVPTAGINGCFGALHGSEDEDDMPSSELREELHDALEPGNVLFVLMDGDWSTNEQVARALATTSFAAEEIGVQVHAPDFGFMTETVDGNEVQSRLGYDDWFVREYGTNREVWPTADEVMLRVMALPKVPLADLEATHRFSMSKLGRFNDSFVDKTDRGNATQWLRLIGKQNVHHLRDKNEWLLWNADRRRWVNQGGFPSEAVNEVARYYYRLADRYSARAAELVTDDKTKGDELKAKAATLRKWANGRCSSVAGREALLKDAASRIGIAVTTADFDPDGDLMAFQNGIVDLRTGEFREEEQKDLIYRRAKVNYPVDGQEPTGPSADRIKQFLAEITALAHGSPAPDRLRWLQRRLGAAARGRNSLNSFEIWAGEGSNGKSVLAKLVESTFGAYATSVPAGVLLTSPGKGRDPEAATPFLMTTVGVRFALMSETRDTDHLDVQKVKHITGGDTQAGRGNYQNAVSFEPTATYFLLTNHVPHVANVDAALIDRLSINRFMCRWRRSGAVIEARDGEHSSLPAADSWFVDKAPQDQIALAWFAWWVVQGSVAYEREGLGDVPADVKAIIREYLADQDVLGHWIEESTRIVFKPSGRVRASAVYHDYKNWCEKNGKQPVSANILTKRILERWPGQITNVRSNGSHLVGLTENLMVYDPAAAPRQVYGSASDGSAA